MNKKFEDFKINNINRSESKPKEIVKDNDNHNPTYSHTKTFTDDPSKYEFLNKKSKITVSKTKWSQSPEIRTKKHSFSKTLVFFSFICLIIVSVYILSTVFFQANITVSAKNKTFELKDQVFTASKDKPNEVPFELMSVSDSVYQSVVLTSSSEASEKAKGEINLFNEYSTKAQKIASGTFVSDENGKTYKIDTTVSIPGYTLDKTKQVLPGQISVGITAFLPGDTYNGEPKSFSINSFKGTNKFKKIYANAKTPLSGGMSGLVYVLGDTQKETISQNIATLKDKLSRKLNAQVPDGYIIYPDSISFASDQLGDLVSKTPDTKIEMKGTISSVIFKESDLLSIIISTILPSISTKEKSEIVEPDISNLSFKFINKNQIVNKDIQSFDFTLTGSLPLRWNPNVEELKGSLVGKYKNDVALIFKQDPGILSAKVKIIPIWSKKLPDDTKNIHIIVK